MLPMSCYENRKVFLTGGTGLIGSEVVTALQKLDFDVYGLTIDEENPENGVHWIKGNLFSPEQIDFILAQIKPTYLLNFAWCANGDYLNSDLNYKFRDAGLDLLRAFKKYGGRRAVYVGTCFEYEFKDRPLKETDTLNPKTLYASCKNELHYLAAEYAAQNDISFGWGRIFYVYGRHEHPNRLTASIINSLCKGETVTIRTSHLQKDYMYTKDIAGAFAAFLDSKVEGAVNICSGKAISIKDFATAIAQEFGRTDLLDMRCEETTQPPLIVGDNTRLTDEVGYKLQYKNIAADELLKEDGAC